MMWVHQRLVAVVVADVGPMQSISRPHSAPAIVVVSVVIVGRAGEEREAMEAMMEETVMEAELRRECSMRPKEAGATEMWAYHGSGARADARGAEAGAAEMRAHHGSGVRAYARAAEAGAAKAAAATEAHSMPATEAATASSHRMSATTATHAAPHAAAVATATHAAAVATATHAAATTAAVKGQRR
jgi:hypothetical protein